MAKKQITTTDIVPGYKEKYFVQAKATMDKLHALTMEYAEMDNLYDVEGMERIKRQMTGQLEFMGDHFARTKKYKTIGDYLEEQRKELKSDTISLIVEESKSNLSTNQAEKLVYGHSNYQEKLRLMFEIKAFFIKVEVKYDRYVDTLNNIRQSLSLCRKDPNFQPIADDKTQD